jgi:hypothetical protein
MPYDSKRVMWQLSFPATEAEAKELAFAGAASGPPESSCDNPSSAGGGQRGMMLRDEALRRVQGWHSPLVQLLRSTAPKDVYGHPVYDREPEDAQPLGEVGSCAADLSGGVSRGVPSGPKDLSRLLACTV